MVQVISNIKILKNKLICIIKSYKLKIIYIKPFLSPSLSQ